MSYQIENFNQKGVILEFKFPKFEAKWKNTFQDSLRLPTGVSFYSELNMGYPFEDVYCIPCESFLKELKPGAFPDFD